MSYVQGLMEFLKKSPACFQAVAELKKALDAGGFTELKEQEAWRPVSGGKYYVTRNGSSLIAFVLPAEGCEAFRIVAAHTDSPTFRLKSHAELRLEDKYTRIDAEGYGGMLYATWLDRPLSVAGRVFVREENALRGIPVCVDRDLLLIPNVAIHMNRAVNDGYKYLPQTDLVPLMGSGEAAGDLAGIVAEAAGVRPENIVSSDLFLYNRQQPVIWGARQEYLSAPRLDDLECVYAGLQAILGASGSGAVQVFAAFDNEEVGSLTRQGADSTFLSDTLQRITLALGGTREEYLMALARSFLISADNAHAVHPNHPELSDPANRVFMNEGVVIKHNAAQKYASDALSCALFEAICGEAGVPVQHYANRSDIRGGSTLGNISGSHVSVSTVDIGLAQLAMHSCYETAGVRDIDHMVHAMQAFYGRDWRFTADSRLEL